MIVKRFAALFDLQMGKDSRANFRWDFTAAAIFSFFNVVFNQFYIPIAIQHGVSYFQVGLLSAAPALGVVLSPVWASFIEQGSPKPYVVYPAAISRLLILIPAFFAFPWVFVICALAFQLLNGVQAPAYAALMTRIYPPKLRGRLMGNVRVIMGGLMIPIAFLVGGWIDLWGSKGPLIFASLTGVLSIAAFSRVKEIEPVPEKQTAAKRSSIREQWKLVKNNRILALFLTAVSISGFGNLLANPLFQIIQVDRLQLSNLQIGYARIVYYVFLLLSYLIMGWVIDRFSPGHAMFFGISASATASLLYGLMENYPIVILASGMQGFGDAIWDIGVMAYIFRAAPGREAVVFGLHLMLFGFRGTIAPLLSTGLSGSVSLSLLLLAAAAFGYAGLAVFAFGHKLEQKKRLESLRSAYPDKIEQAR